MKKIKSLLIVVSSLYCITANSAARQLEEVIVTAQKQAKSMQDIPASVSSIDSIFLKEAGLSEVGQIVEYTPNVSFNDSIKFFPIITMRGYGTAPFSRGLEPSIGLVVDDIPYGRTSYVNDAVFDVAKFEVLRGPQGSLFGKNTIAGLFNVVTFDPSFEWDGYLTAGLGRKKDRHAEFAQSITLIEDVLAARIVARKSGSDTVYNTANDNQGTVDDEAFRLKIKWFISEQSELLLNAWTSELNQEEVSLQLSRATEQSLTQYRKFDPDIETDEYNDNTSASTSALSSRKTETIGLIYKYAFDNSGLFSNSEFSLNSAYSQILETFLYDADASPMDLVSFGSLVPDAYQQNHIETRFTSDLKTPFGLGENINVMLGLFYNEVDTTSSTQVIFNLCNLAGFIESGGTVGPLGFPIVTPVILPCNSTPENHQNLTETHIESQAIFSQMDWEFNEQWSLILGMRYGENKLTGSIDSFSTSDTNISGGSLGYETFSQEHEQSEYDFSPKIAVTWRPTDDLTLFVTRTQGFKGGGVASGVYKSARTTYTPETSTSSEVGLKAELFDRTLRFNVTAFHSEFQDLQVQNFDGQTIFVTNASDSYSTGIELDFLWVTPLSWLTIGGSAGYVDAAYENYFCGVPDPDEEADDPANAACDTSQTSPTQTEEVRYEDQSGEPLPNAADVSAAVYFNVNYPFDNGLSLISGFDIIHRGEAEVDQDPFYVQQPITKFAARVGVNSEAGWSLILNGKNLTAEKERIFGAAAPGVVGNNQALATDDVLWTLDFRYDWSR